MKKFLDFFYSINLIKKEDINYLSDKIKCSAKNIDGVISINIELNQPIEPKRYFHILNKIKNIDKTIDINFTANYSEFNVNNLIDYLLYFIDKNNLNNKDILLNILNRRTATYENHIFNLYYLNQNEEYVLNQNKSSFKKFLERCDFVFDDIELSIDKITTEVYNHKKDKKEMVNSQVKRLLESTKNMNFQSKEVKQFNKVKKGDITPLANIFHEMLYAYVRGEIFKIDSVKTKTGHDIIKFYITDHTDSIVLKIFPKEKGITKEYIDSFKIGHWIEANIKIQLDPFENNDISGTITAMKAIPIPSEFVRVDDEPTKRVEFIVHTNMTASEGLVKPKELFKTLKELGHKKVAITDKSDCQSFPIAAKLAKENDIDVIYGAQFEMLKKNINLVINPIDKKPYDCEIVFFDLETTGLSGYYDKIIEFGAIKYFKGKVIDKIEFFVNPGIDIPEHITKITQITNDDVKNGIPIKEALIKIREFFGHAIIVAHNGFKFDIPFLNCKFAEHNMPLITNTSVDTLYLSRALNEQISGHTLGAICRKFKINYDETVAHRSLVDCEYLLLVWKKFIEILEKEQIFTFKEINERLENNEYLKSRTRGHWVTVYCLKKKFMRDFYKLVSISLTDNFYEGAKIYKENIDDNKKCFLISNSPTEGELIDKAMSDTDLELKKAISYYDFITISPLSCFAHEISRKVYSEEAYIDATKRIIKFAKELNKLVIASSDTYYINRSDKQFFDVYVHSKSIGGKRHRFYRYDGQNEVMPDLFYRTTQEMKHEFSFLKDKELIEQIVVKNPNAIADMFEPKIKPIKDELFSPSINGAEEKLKELIYENARKIYGEKIDQIILDRINREIESVISNGYAMIYWFSHLLVKQSINDGYVVGSRGSVGSSLAAWLVNITEVNPLPPHYLCPNCKYIKFMNEYQSGFDLPNQNCPYCNNKLISDGHNVPFETFMGFDGDKIPDIDLNFSAVYQSRAHEFIREMFGKSKVLRAGTIGTVAEKTAYGLVKGYFESIGKDKVRGAEITRMATKCEDVKRTTGQHPGGIIVIPNEFDVYDFTPVNYPADDKSQGWLTTHFAFEYLHDTLLKFDILGHDNPTVLKMLTEKTNVDPDTIPMHDDKVMELFSSTESLDLKFGDVNEILKVGTNGVPEFGTNFVKEMLLVIRPKKFSDLIRISGLSHGTFVWTNNAKDLIETGGVKISEVISCRDDIMVYLIQKGIDLLKSFKIMEDIRKGKQLTPEYEKLLKEKNIPEWYINSCNKIQYLFPKAHATAYVIMAWKIAWFKIYYPLYFYSSFLSIRTQSFDLRSIIAGKHAIEDKINDIKKRYYNNKTKSTVTNKEWDLLPIYEICLEMVARGYAIKNIDLNKSLATEFVVEDSHLIAPFSAIDGLGEAVANSIVEARKERPFTSKEDLMERTKLTKTHLSILNELGVLKHLEDDNQISFF